MASFVEGVIYTENDASANHAMAGIGIDGRLDISVGPPRPHHEVITGELRAANYLQDELDKIAVARTPEQPNLSLSESLWMMHIATLKNLNPITLRNQIMFYMLNPKFPYNEAHIVESVELRNLQNGHALSPYAPSVASTHVAEELGLRYAGTAEKHLAANGLFADLSHKGHFQWFLESLKLPTFPHTDVTENPRDAFLAASHADYILQCTPYNAWIGKANIGSGGENVLTVMNTTTRTDKRHHSFHVPSRGLFDVPAPRVFEIIKEFAEKAENGITSQPYIPPKQSPSMAIAVINGEIYPKWGTIQKLADPLNGDVRFKGNEILPIDVFRVRFSDFYYDVLKVTKAIIQKYSIKDILLGFDGHTSLFDSIDRIVECNARRLAPDSLKAAAEARFPIGERDKFNIRGFDGLWPSSGNIELPTSTTQEAVLATLARERILLGQESLFGIKSEFGDNFIGTSLIYPIESGTIVWAVYGENETQQKELAQRTLDSLSGLQNPYLIGHLPELRPEMYNAAINLYNKQFVYEYT